MRLACVLTMAASLCAAAPARADAPPEPWEVPDLTRATLDALPPAPTPCRAERHLRAKAYAKLDALLARARRAGRLPESFTPWLEAHLGPLTRSSRLLPDLDAWCKQAPRSAFARLARAEAWIAAALRLRGPDPTVEPDPRLARRIAARYEQADEDLAAAAKLDPKLARVHAQRVRVAAGRNLATAALVERFEAAVAVDPNDITAHLALLEALTPDQGGSWAALFAFAKKCAASGEREPALYFVLGRAHEVAARASEAPVKYLARADVRDALRTAFQALAEAYPKALPLLRLRDRLDRLRKNDATRATWTRLRLDADDPQTLLRVGAAAWTDTKRPAAKRWAGLRQVLRAAYLGSGPAATWVALRLKARKEWKPCAAWLQVAHTRGDPNAAFDLGLLTWRGHGVKADRREAVALWRAAAAGAEPAVAGKARRWLEYVLNKHPKLLKQP